MSANSNSLLHIGYTPDCDRLSERRTTLPFKFKTTFENRSNSIGDHRLLRELQNIGRSETLRRRIFICSFVVIGVCGNTGCLSTYNERRSTG